MKKHTSKPEKYIVELSIKHPYGGRYGKQVICKDEADFDRWLEANGHMYQFAGIYLPSEENNYNQYTPTYY